jgi:hypothetical protein
MATEDKPRPGDGADSDDESPVTVEKLTDTDGGRWQVTTRTSIYLIDLDRRTVMRIPGTSWEHGIRGGRVVYYVATLEGDRRSLPLARLHTCVVGRDMHLITREAGEPRLRTSTPVREIRRLPTPPQSRGHHDRGPAPR